MDAEPAIGSSGPVGVGAEFIQLRIQAETCLPAQRQELLYQLYLFCHKHGMAARMPALRQELARAAVARQGGADADAAGCKDTLGILPAAKGVSSYMLHPDTAATAMAVYGAWGQGKSTFMKLVEQQMLLQAALDQVDLLEMTDAGVLHAEFAEIADRINSNTATDVDINTLAALATPRLMTVWFNAWEYLNEEQVWSGLVVETIKRLQEKLDRQHLGLMRHWWRGFRWGLWLHQPHRFCLAWRYNWQQRRKTMLLTWLLPILLLACVLLPLTVYGAMHLVKHHPVAAATIITAGPLATLLGVLERTFKVIKEVSAVVEAAETHMSLKHHHSRIGYQQQVKADMRTFKELMQEHLQPLADHRPRPGTTTEAALAAAAQQAKHTHRHAKAAEKAEQYARAASSASCTSVSKEAEYAAEVALAAHEAARAAATATSKAAQRCAAAQAAAQEMRAAQQKAQQKAQQPAQQAAQQELVSAASVSFEDAGNFPFAASKAWQEARCYSARARRIRQWLTKGRTRATSASAFPSEVTPEELPTLSAKSSRCSEFASWLLWPRPKLHLPDSLRAPLRMVVFIDDLDRCKPDKVVEVLEAINLVLADSGYSVLLGVDKHFICQAIKKAYRDSGIKTDAQAEAFLLKVVQIDLNLPSPSTDEVQKYLESLHVCLDVDALQKQARAANTDTNQPSASPGTTGSTTGSPIGSSTTGIPAGAAADGATGSSESSATGGAAVGATGSSDSSQEEEPLQLQRRLHLLSNQRGYSVKESYAMRVLLEHKLLAKASPREMKRLLNRYRLAKYIMLEQYTERKELGEVKEQVYVQLLGWVALWWAYPQGMTALMQYDEPDALDWSDLKQLVQLRVTRHQAEVDRLQRKPKEQRSEEEEAQLERYKLQAQQLEKVKAFLVPVAAGEEWPSLFGFLQRQWSLPTTASEAAPTAAAASPEQVEQQLRSISRDQADKFKTFGWGFV